MFLFVGTAAVTLLTSKLRRSSVMFWTMYPKDFVFSLNGFCETHSVSLAYIFSEFHEMETVLSVPSIFLWSWSQTSVSWNLHPFVAPLLFCAVCRHYIFIFVPLTLSSTYTCIACERFLASLVVMLSVLRSDCWWLHWPRRSSNNNRKLHYLIWTLSFLAVF